MITLNVLKQIPAPLLVWFITIGSAVISYPKSTSLKVNLEKRTINLINPISMMVSVKKFFLIRGINNS